MPFDTQLSTISPRRGLNLEYLTLGWNVITVLVIGVAAFRAHSVALAGVGLDSLIEIFASVVVIWHLRVSVRHREKFALRLIGVSFLSLGAYIIGQLYTYSLRAVVQPPRV